MNLGQTQNLRHSLEGGSGSALQTGKRRFLLFLNSCPENCEVQNSGQRKNCRYKVRAELEIISL